MRDSRYRKDRRVGLDAELFYFFINFRDLLFEQLDLAYEMFYLDLFRNGGDANGILCSELKFLGSQRNTIAPAGGFKAITKRADIRRSDFSALGKFLRISMYTMPYLDLKRLLYSGKTMSIHF